MGIFCQRGNTSLEEQRKTLESAPSGSLEMSEILSWQSRDALSQICRRLDIKPPNWRTKADMAQAILDSDFGPTEILIQLQNPDLQSILQALGYAAWNMRKDDMVNMIIEEM